MGDTNAFTPESSLAPVCIQHQTRSISLDTIKDTWDQDCDDDDDWD